MNHDKLSAAPVQEVDDWGTPKPTFEMGDWDSPTTTPETAVESPKRKGLMGKLGKNIAPKFFERRKLVKGAETLQDIKDAQFQPLGEKPVFKHGSNEAFHTALLNNADWNEAHAMNATHDAQKEVDARASELAWSQASYNEHRRKGDYTPGSSTILEELDSGQVKVGERKLAEANAKLAEAKSKQSFQSSLSEVDRNIVKTAHGWGAPETKSDDW